MSHDHTTRFHFSFMLRSIRSIVILSISIASYIMVDHVKGKGCTRYMQRYYNIIILTDNGFRRLANFAI